jgi:uncharacterized protein YjbJ (UPF0337 family)
MGIFNELEKLTAKTGDVVGSVIQDLSTKTTGWGQKADAWVEENLDKVKESAKKAEKDSTDVPADTATDLPEETIEEPYVADSTSATSAEAKPEAPKPAAPAPKI